MGRPTKFSETVADAICDRLAHGESLLQICKDDELPSDTTVYRWLDEDESFRDKYARARDQQADFYVSKGIEIVEENPEMFIPTKAGGYSVVDAAGVARNRLRWDALRWYASKLAPKKYGDKLGLDVTGELSIAGAVNRIRDRVNDNQG